MDLRSLVSRSYAALNAFSGAFQVNFSSGGSREYSIKEGSKENKKKHDRLHDLFLS